MNAVSRDFVYGKFSDFYNDQPTVIPPPASLSQREFGFFLSKERIMLRHQGFANIKALKAFLKEEVPSDAYRSCAYYENPKTAEMDKKGWLGADLVFDIDADHIPTSCNKLHDEWTCKKCGLTNRGEPPKRCSCGGEKFDTKTWVCEQCLGSAKNETTRLIDILQNDFGFSNEEIHVFFSGHRGYHVHVENEAVKSLGAMGRKEIVDYVTGLGLTISKRVKGEEKASEKFFLSDFAWNKRIKQGMKKFISSASLDDLKKIGLKRASDVIFNNKELILRRCITKGFWDSIDYVKLETWKKIAEHVKDLESAKIDTVVTTDTHRLIRMNGTLHGKTGLKKVEFPVTRLADFDPFEEAVAFKEGAVKVFVPEVPEFRLGGRVFGPYKNKTVEIPTAAAILLICKGRAEVAN